MRLYTRIKDEFYFTLDDYISSDILEDIVRSEVFIPDRDSISLECLAKLNEELLAQFVRLGAREEVLSLMMFVFRRWFLEQTREYLLVNDYTPEDEISEIEEILQKFSRYYKDPDVLDIPKRIQANYEAIEAFHNFDTGYLEIFDEDAFPNFCLNLDVHYKENNKRPFTDSRFYP